jgi:hypothetical protein
MTVELTGKPISPRGVTAYRIRDGKWVEGWGNWDLAGTLQQLGAPIPGWYTGARTSRRDPGCQPVGDESS